MAGFSIGCPCPTTNALSHNKLRYTRLDENQNRNCVTQRCGRTAPTTAVSVSDFFPRQWPTNQVFGIYSQFTCDDGAGLFDWVRAQAVFFLPGVRGRMYPPPLHKGALAGPSFLARLCIQNVRPQPSAFCAKPADPAGRDRRRTAGVRPGSELGQPP